MASLSAAHLVPGKGIEGDRFYDAGSASDEGISKERAHLALWLKEIAPSNELRAWFGHDPDKFAEFRQRYEAELATGAAHEALSRLRELARNGPLTLVFAARDAAHANARVLRHLLENGEANGMAREPRHPAAGKE